MKGKQIKGVKNYIRYVNNRISFLEMDVVSCSENQIRYFLGMRDCIKDYAKSHKIFFNYLYGRLDYFNLGVLLGETEKSIDGYLRRQVMKVIKYISRKEIELYAKYPYKDKLKMER